MSMDKLKSAWSIYKTTQAMDRLSTRDVLRLIESPVSHKTHSLLVNLMMLITFLLVCY